jgi:hypothetical protein
MASWSREELRKISETDDLHIAPLREDGRRRITAAGTTSEVCFEPAEKSMNDRIDDCYRKKYHGSPYLEPMIGARARSATVRILPRVTHP